MDPEGGCPRGNGFGALSPCLWRVPPLVALRLLHGTSLPTPGVVHPLPTPRVGPFLPRVWEGAPGGRFRVAALHSPGVFLPPSLPPGSWEGDPRRPPVFPDGRPSFNQSPPVSLCQTSPFALPIPSPVFHPALYFFSLCFLFLALSGAIQTLWCHFCHLLVVT